MSELHQIVKCESCEMIAEIVHASRQTLSCCGSRMKYVEENASDGAEEKHVPVLERVPGGIRVSIGSSPHPMEEKHYIEWIELLFDGLSYKTFLKPGMAPSVIFNLVAPKVAARAYCTIHGLWRAEG